MLNFIFKLFPANSRSKVVKEYVSNSIDVSLVQDATNGLTVSSTVPHIVGMINNQVLSNEDAEQLVKAIINNQGNRISSFIVKD